MTPDEQAAVEADVEATMARIANSAHATAPVEHLLELGLRRGRSLPQMLDEALTDAKHCRKVEARRMTGGGLDGMRAARRSAERAEELARLIRRRMRRGKRAARKDGA